MPPVLSRLLQHPFFPFALLGITWFFGLFVDVMDVDAAQYASMSREMWESKDWLNLYDRGAPYLDKPPLLFWLGSVSIGIFGTADWAYKLPSVLLSLLGLYSTYRLALLFYTKQVAINAAIILGASQAWFLMNHDVRTDMLLTVWIVFSAWHLAAYINEKRWSNLLLAFMGIGFGMLSKGPLAVILPAAGIFFHLLYIKKWKEIFRWQWFIGLALTIVVISPFLYSLYQQFDAHPELKVNERTGVSGIRFFLWEQSFGRITGENVWKNNAGPTFLSESTLWAFLPYTLLLIAGFVWSLIRVLGKKEHRPPEIITFAGFIFGMSALSSSSYQLPHYAFVTYPFAAIFTAQAWELCGSTKWGKIITAAQSFVLIALCIGIALIMAFVFGTASAWLLVVEAILILFILHHIYRYRSEHIFRASWLTAIAINLALALHFYPNVLQYQASSVIGKKLSYEPATNLIGFNTAMPHSFSFYSGKKFEFWPDSQYLVLLKAGEEYTFKTNPKGLSLLEEKGLQSAPPELYLNFKVTELRPAFLNPKRRAETLDTIYLIRQARFAMDGG